MTIAGPQRTSASPVWPSRNYACRDEAAPARSRPPRRATQGGPGGSIATEDPPDISIREFPSRANPCRTRAGEDGDVMLGIGHCKRRERIRRTSRRRSHISALKRTKAPANPCLPRPGAKCQRNRPGRPERHRAGSVSSGSGVSGGRFLNRPRTSRPPYGDRR